MKVCLDHTIVPTRDKQASATFLAEILGLPQPKPFGPFLAVETANEVTLDFIDSQDDFPKQHYAFLVTETEFDEIFGRIRERGVRHWTDPFHREPGGINTNDGGGWQTTGTPNASRPPTSTHSEDPGATTHTGSDGLSRPTAGYGLWASWRRPAHPRWPEPAEPTSSRGRACLPRNGRHS